MVPETVRGNDRVSTGGVRDGIVPQAAVNKPIHSQTVSLRNLVLKIIAR
jgi:hypothetical protein